MNFFFSKSNILTLIFVLLIAPKLFSQSGWVVLNSGTTSELRSVHFINANTGFICAYNGTILKTTNGGANWSSQQTPGFILSSIFFIDQITGYTVGGGGIILKTTNTGQNWVVQTTGTGANMYSVHFPSSNTGYTAGTGGIVRKTTDGGNNWTTIFNNLTGAVLCVFFVDNNTGYTANNAGILNKTTNGGATNWNTVLYVSGTAFLGVRFVDNNTGWVVGESGFIRKTTNGGMSWISQGYSGPTNFLRSIYMLNYFTGFAAGGNMSNNSSIIIKTTNSGTNWFVQLIPTTNQLWSIFFIDSLTGYAVGYNGTILKTTTGGVLPIEPISNEVPKEFKLYQNYPNPFNPSSKIKFQISKLSEAKLVIFDVLGREVSTLVNEKLKPGTYEVEFDPEKSGQAGLSSGVYYYRLISDDYIETRKMVLLR